MKNFCDIFRVFGHNSQKLMSQKLTSQKLMSQKLMALGYAGERGNLKKTGEVSQA